MISGIHLATALSVMLHMEQEGESVGSMDRSAEMNPWSVQYRYQQQAAHRNQQANAKTQAYDDKSSNIVDGDFIEADFRVIEDKSDGRE